jgi:hypothetical protein
MRIKEQAQEKEVSYSLDLDDHVTHESAAPYQQKLELRGETEAEGVLTSIATSRSGSRRIVFSPCHRQQILAGRHG